MSIAGNRLLVPSRIEVGVAQMRAQLSRYLSQVQKGTEIVVTDHGRPVAYVTGHQRTRLDELIAQGRARPPKRYSRTKPDPVEYEGTLEDITSTIRSNRR